MYSIPYYIYNFMMSLTKKKKLRWGKAIMGILWNKRSFNKKSLFLVYVLNLLENSR